MNAAECDARLGIVPPRSDPRREDDHSAATTDPGWRNQLDLLMLDAVDGDLGSALSLAVTHRPRAQ
jgi:hypothetical protein